jgi:predicted MFS family arabinose efflux permease
MIVVAQIGDRRGDRKLFLGASALIGAVALATSMAYQGQTTLAMIALTIATAAILTAFAQFWRLPTLLLGGDAAAAGIAIITSVANLSGFVSPYLIGWLRDTTGSGAAGSYVTAGSLALAAIVVTLLPARTVNR